MYKLVLLACCLSCSSSVTPDQFYATVERYACYDYAGVDATRKLYEQCPIVEGEERKVTLTRCPGVAKILQDLDQALLACDKE